ncbi:hypothetical protein K501DRAFT_157622, partial [Backusella circina FSU 941]
MVRFLNDPVNFSGDVKTVNPQIWLQKLDRIQELASLSDKEIMLIAADHMVDRAGKWFSMTFRDPAKTKWTDFKKSFDDKYCKGQEDLWWSEISSVKQKDGESVEDLEIRIRELYDLVGVDNNIMIVRTYLDALKPEIAWEIERHGFDKSNLNKLVEKARCAELVLDKYQARGYHHNIKSEATCNSTAVSMEELMREVQQLKLQINRPKPIIPVASAEKRVFKCFGCGKEGHRKQDCPE